MRLFQFGMTDKEFEVIVGIYFVKAKHELFSLRIVYIEIIVLLIKLIKIGNGHASTEKINSRFDKFF